MGQQSWAKNIGTAQAGQAKDSHSFNSRKENGVIEGAIEVNPGQGVVRGSGGIKVVLPTAAGGLFVGIVTLQNDRYFNPKTDTLDPYTDTDGVTLATEEVWEVLTEEPVVEGGDVFMRHTAGAGGTITGYFRTDADTATAEQVKMKWAETKDTAGFAKARLILAQV